VELEEGKEAAMSQVVVQVEEKLKPLGEVVAAKLVTARAMVITDQASYNAVVEMRQTLKTLRDAIEEAHRERKEATNKAHQAAVDAERAELSPVQEAEKVLKALTFAWDAAQEALRRAEQARLDAEAKRKTQEEAIAAAAAAEAAGAPKEEVDSILDNPPPPPPVVAPKAYVAAPRMAGRESWSGKVTDLQALIRFVAANPGFQNLLQVNQTALNQLARSQKSMMKIPGVEALSQRV
jgi:hypothetical protein